MSMFYEHDPILLTCCAIELKILIMRDLQSRGAARLCKKSIIQLLSSFNRTTRYFVNNLFRSYIFKSDFLITFPIN
jgi:hypothetical protein